MVDITMSLDKMIHMMEERDREARQEGRDIVNELRTFRKQMADFWMADSVEAMANDEQDSIVGPKVKELEKRLEVLEDKAKMSRDKVMEKEAEIRAMLLSSDNEVAAAANPEEQVEGQSGVSVIMGLIDDFNSQLEEVRREIQGRILYIRISD